MAQPLIPNVSLILILLAATVGMVSAEPPRLPSQGSHFLALLLPAPDRPSVEQVLEPLRRTFPDLGWTPAAKLHLTLAYVGPLDRETRARLVSSLADELKDQQAFDLGFRGMGTFTFARSTTPRVLWARPVGDGEALGRVAAACRRALHRSCGRDDSLAFVPHMTLGRAEGPRLGPRLAAARDAAAPLRTSLRSVGQVVLLRGGSPLDRGRYTVLAHFPLRARGNPQP